MNRRSFIRETMGTGFSAVLSSAAHPLFGASKTDGQYRLGICAASCAIRSRMARQKGAPPQLSRFAGPVGQLQYFARYRSACAQIGVGGWNRPGLVRQIREEVEASGTKLEGQIRLPKDGSDVERFAAEVKFAKEAGVTIFRTACLGTRRYETFHSLDEWTAFQARARKSLGLAEKVAAKMGVRLAVENHKDWRTEELLDLLRRIDSPHVGVNLDTGNNIALLEDPMEVIEALAPHALTLHLKDMGVAEYEDGFLLAEIPLGEGMVDIQKVVEICRKANPQVQFNLEMITRDPLKIPCLTDEYWLTFGEVKGRVLASALKNVRRHNRDDLQKIGRLPALEQMAAEEENIRRSFDWWKGIYG